MKNIEIITEHLMLKPLGTEHFQTTKEYAMDYENTKYMYYISQRNKQRGFCIFGRCIIGTEKRKPRVL